MSLEIKDLITPLRKWWWLILLATLVAGVASYLATSQQPDRYRSQASLMVGNALNEINPSSADFFTSQQLAEYYVGLANRGSVRVATQQALETQCDCKIQWPQTFVYRYNDSNAIDIIVEDSSPQLAQAVAAELANQLILRSPTAQQSDSEREQFVEEQLDNLQAAIRQTEAQLVEKREELAGLISAREISNVQGEIVTLETNLQSLQANYATLLQTTNKGATNTIRLIEPASQAWLVPQSNLITVLTAAGVGFALAAAAAYVLEFLDDSVKTPEQLRRIVNLSTLAGIAEIDDDMEKLITIAQPRSPIAEAFRVLRTAIQFSTMDSAAHSLLVTSAVPQEGKTTITANLAVVMARAGHQVLLIDADLRRPSQHRIFDLPNRRGLTSLLLEFSRAKHDDDVLKIMKEVIQPTSVDGLYLLTCGFVPPNPSELLGSARMKMLLDRLSAQYDILILDSAPLLAVTDSTVLSTQVGSTLLVVRAGKSRKGHVQQSVDSLREVHANVIGCVFNGLTPKSEGYNFYHYYQESYYVADDDGLDKMSEEMQSDEPGRPRGRSNGGKGFSLRDRITK